MKHNIFTNKLTKNLCGIFVLSLGLAFTAPAFAAGDITVSTPHRTSSNMASNLYLGVQLANANYDKVDDSSAAFGVFGGYHLNEIIAVEAAYNDFGTAEGSSSDAEVTAFSLGMLVKVPAKTDLTFFGKVGLSMWDIEASPGSFSDSGNDVYFGVGAGYDISGPAAVRFGIDAYTIEGDVDEDITVFSIGLTYEL